MKVWLVAKAIAVHSKITDYVFYLGVSPYLAKESVRPSDLPHRPDSLWPRRRYKASHRRPPGLLLCCGRDDYL